MKNEPDVPGMTPERRQLLTTMTRGDAEEGAQAWREHARQCRAVGMAPTPFTNWLAEWLECRRAEAARPLQEDPELADEGRHEARDYARMFEGVRE